MVAPGLGQDRDHTSDRLHRLRLWMLRRGTRGGRSRTFPPPRLVLVRDGAWRGWPSDSSPCWNTIAAPVGDGAAQKARRIHSSPAAYYRWRDNTSLFTAVGAWGCDKVTLTGGRWPERVQVQRVAGDYLAGSRSAACSGTRLSTGRRASTDCPMLVSAHLRRNSFGSDTGIVAARDEVE